MGNLSLVFLFSKRNRFWYDHHSVEPAGRCIANIDQVRELEVGEAHRECAGQSRIRLYTLNIQYCFKVINAGDAMEFISGGFYRATIHR
jgi:hypothetical protein